MRTFSRNELRCPNLRSRASWSGWKPTCPGVNGADPPRYYSDASFSPSGIPERTVALTTVQPLKWREHDHLRRPSLPGEPAGTAFATSQKRIAHHGNLTEPRSIPDPPWATAADTSPCDAQYCWFYNQVQRGAGRWNKHVRSASAIPEARAICAKTECAAMCRTG
jgi:hypothetical protein